MNYKNHSNIIEKEFGKLKVIKFHDYIMQGKKRKPRYLCICSCGKQKICLKERLLDGRNTSCGHQSTNNKNYIKGSSNVKRIFHRGKNNVRFTGYEEISGSKWDKIKRGAKSRNLEFNISIQDAWSIFLKQNRKCALSGMKLQFTISSQMNKTTASLDRIDSSQGYTINNIQWIHKDINRMKMNLNEKYFINICRKIANYVKT